MSSGDFIISDIDRINSKQTIWQIGKQGKFIKSIRLEKKKMPRSLPSYFCSYLRC